MYFAGMDVVDRVAQRSVAERTRQVADEVRRVIDATYVVIDQTRSLEPPMRAILRESGCSTQAFYRHFASKDDLLAVLLDDGWRRLCDDVARQMEEVDGVDTKVTAWIERVMHQAIDGEIAARTRPFIAGMGRLEARFPEELGRSRARLVQTLADVLPGPHADRDALATFDLAFGAMQRHVLAVTAPERAEIDHLVAYALGAINRAA
jgi:AcrR family transcriptional regulator